MLKDKGLEIELDVIYEKFKKVEKPVRIKGKLAKDENGKQLKELIEVYSGFCVIPTTFIKTGITYRSPAMNHQNRLYKTRSTIFDKYTQKFYVVNHRVEDLERGLKKLTETGFRINQ